jgi:hypothetical protein
MLTTHLQLVPTSRKCGSIHPLPHTSSWGSTYLIKERGSSTFCLSNRKQMSTIMAASICSPAPIVNRRAANQRFDTSILPSHWVSNVGQRSLLPCVSGGGGAVFPAFNAPSHFASSWIQLITLWALQRKAKQMFAKWRCSVEPINVH